jgi:rsbT co-antagonist protein RsbR
MSEERQTIAALQAEVAALRQRLQALGRPQETGPLSQGDESDLVHRRDRILDAISFVAEHFLRTDDIHASIQVMLERLGQVTSVSRVYVFENHMSVTGMLMMSQRYEWVSEGVQPQINNPELQALPYREAGFDRWIEILESGQAIYGNLATFSEAERVILEPQDILFLAVVPVFVGSQWWGFIGFDECVTERVWSEMDIRALSAAATIMGSAIQRKTIDEEREALQQQIIDSQQSTLRELSSPLIPLSDSVVLMPLIGTIDSMRAQTIMETLLEGVAQHQATIAIVDITGVSVVDTQVANALIQAAQAVRLLGARVVLTGIGSTMAQTLVHLGADMQTLETRGSLQSAVGWALNTVRAAGK